MASRDEMLKAIHSFEQLVMKTPDTSVNCSVFKWTIDYLEAAEFTLDSMNRAEAQIKQNQEAIIDVPTE